MADVKISGLPASTVPLAGTEVLPIVQGGITRQVSVANLTAGRNVATADLTTTGNTILGDASTDTLNVGNGGLVKDASGNVGVGVSPAAWSGFRALQVGSAGSIWSSTSSNGSFFLSQNTYFNGANRIALNAGTAAEYILDNTGNHIWYNAVSAAAGGVLSMTERMRITAAGNVNVTTGNLVIGTSGKGIDFSATAGTGTSELLADYEEGDWTPVIAASSGSITSYTTTNCKYTKIGRQVTLNGTFGITDNGTGIGAVTISSVPFAILNSIAGGVAREAAVNGLMSMIVAGNTGTLNMTLYNNVYPGVTGGSYTFTVTYFV
jgi:hypothetical protein